MEEHESESKELKKFDFEKLEALRNRVEAHMAEKTAIVNTWIPKEVLANIKSDEELAAEEAELFRHNLPHLGVGAPLPAEYLISEEERNNKALRARFFAPKHLKASKKRDAEEKAASLKRGMREDSSDEDVGRSALGKSKRPKTTARPVHFAVEKEESPKSQFKSISKVVEPQQAEPRPLPISESSPRSDGASSPPVRGTGLGEEGVVNDKTSSQVTKNGGGEERVLTKKERRAIKVQKKKEKKQKLRKQYARLGGRLKDKRERKGKR